MYLLESIDGETGQPGAEFLRELEARARETVRWTEQQGICQAAAEARRIRHCLWEGQHWTERKMSATGDTEAKFPFEGASDIRLRMADFLVNQRVAECFTALMRAQVSFGSPANKNTEAAKWCAQAWKDIRTREMPLEWIVQNLLLANYLHGGGRGVAGLWIGWKREQELRPARTTREEARALWVELRGAFGDDPVSASDSFDGALAEPEAGNPDGLADILRELALARNAREARTGARAMRNKGWAELAVPKTVCDRPQVRALALGDSLWLPPDTAVADLDSSNELHLTEWHTRAGIRAMAAAEGWDKRFTEQLIGDGERDNGQAGKAVFPVYELEADDQNVSRVEAREMRDRYQIVRSFLLGVDRDGVRGRYECVWNGHVKDVAAKGLRLVREAHGKWPVQVYASEVAGPLAMDSRSVPALASGLQTHAKIAHDMVANLSMLQLPPVVTKGRRDKGALLIEPLGEVELGLSGDAQFMRMPQVSETTRQYLTTIKAWRDEYFGLPSAEIPPQIWQNQQAMRVWLWLAQSAESVRRVVSIFAGRMEVPPEGLEEGTYSLPVQMTCDPREFDMEHIKATAEVLNLILPMDRAGELNLSETVKSLALGLLPAHAELVTKDPERASEDELRDEQRNLTLVRQGVRPRIPEGGGANYAGRLAMYREMEAANPAVFADMGPDKQQLLKEHVAALEQAATQYGENRDIGRYGAKKQVGAVEA